jgi:large subunit ribosomal protein L4
MADIKAPLYKADGSADGEIKLDAEVFGIEPNMDVLHQVVTAQLAAARSGTAATKTRGQVRGGGRKPWRQKGLGRARHGSIRSPIWVGGGVAHGPQPRSYAQRTPKKMKRLALRSALSARASEAAIRVVSDLDWSAPKTKQAVSLLDAMGAQGKTLVVLTQLDGSAARSFRNLADVRLVEPGHLTAYDVLWSDQVVFTSHTVGSVGRSSKYEVSDSDFVKDEAAGKSPEPTQDGADES